MAACSVRWTIMLRVWSLTGMRVFMTKALTLFSKSSVVKISPLTTATILTAPGKASEVSARQALLPGRPAQQAADGQRRFRFFVFAVILKHDRAAGRFGALADGGKVERLSRKNRGYTKQESHRKKFSH